MNLKTTLKNELKTEHCTATFPVFQNIYANNIEGPSVPPLTKGKKKLLSVLFKTVLLAPFCCLPTHKEAEKFSYFLFILGLLKNP